MFQRILVPLDGTTRAEEALPIAAQLARATSASLILLRVVTHPIPTMLPTEPEFLEWTSASDLSEAKKYLERVVTYEHLDTIQVHTEVLEGAPAPSILHYAQLHQVDLIILRSHGETGLKRWVFGSTGQRFARHSPVPVLVLRDSCLPAHTNFLNVMHPPRILVPLDGSSLAEAALVPAAQLCAALASPEQGALHLTYTVLRHSVAEGKTRAHIERMNKEARAEAEAYLKNIGQRFVSGDLAQFHLTVTTSVVAHSDGAEVWKRVIEESECIGDVPGYSGCDMIAMATHGRRGFQHLLYGSVMERVLDVTKHPLLVVHVQDTKLKAPALAETHNA